MIDGGADISRLGLDLDGREFIATGERAARILEALAAASEQAKAEVAGLDRTQQDAARSTREAALVAERMADILREGAAERSAIDQAEAADRQARREADLAHARAVDEERHRAAAEASERAHADARQREEAFAREAAEDAARQGQEQAFAQIVAMEQALASEMARVREATVRGLMTPDQAREAAREAAEAYNAQLLQVLDEARATGALEAEDGAGIYAAIVSSFKDLDQQGRNAAAGVGRLNQSLASAARQAIGVHPAIGQVANTIGSLALGGAVMTGVLAGAAALSLAWRKWTEDARNARAESEAVTERLQRLRDQANQGLFGNLGADVVARGREIADLRAELQRLVDLQERLDAAPGPSGGVDVEVQRRNRGRRIADIREEIDEQVELLRHGEQEIQRISIEAYRSEQQTQASRLAGLVASGRATVEERDRLIEIRRSQEFALARLEEAGISSETMRARADAASMINQITAAFEQRRDAAQRAAEASARVLSDLRRQVEEERALSAALQVSEEAYDEQARAIERSNAVRQAQAQAIEADKAAAAELAGILHDERVERERLSEAKRLEAEVQRSDEEVAQLREMLELTREHTGTVEELREAQQALAEDFEARRQVEVLISEGWDPAAAQARVEAEAALRAEIQGVTRARTDQEKAEEFLRGRRRELDDTQRLIALHERYRAGSKELEAAIRAYNQKLAERAMLEAAIRSGFDGDIGSLQEFIREYVEAQGKLRDLGTAGASAANVTQQAWSAALGAISTGVGGLASELASIAQAGLAGGPIGLIGAGLGSILSRAFGGGGREEAAREQARLAEEARRAADALADFTRNLDDDMRVRRARLDGDDLGVDLERLRQSQRNELDEALQRFVDRFGPGRSPQGLIDELFGRPGPEGRTNEELRALVEGSRGNITDEAANAILQWLDLLDLQAREMQDIYERHAAREAQEAERRRQSLEDFETDMARLSLVLSDDERALRMFDLEKAFDRQMDAYRELEREGIITAEQLEEMARLLRDQVNAALDEFDEAARRAAQASREAAEAERRRAEEAAMAERLRQATDEERLRIQILRAQGLEEDARLAENQLALDIALREGRSSNYLIMLQQLQALNALNDAQQRSAQGAAAAARALGGATNALNASPLFNAAWARTTVMGAATRTAGGGGSARPVVQNFEVTIQGSSKSGRELLREMQLEADRIRRRGGGDPWDSVEA